jgi:glycosyltransferase involved in cell wall biosynthesis
LSKPFLSIVVPAYNAGAFLAVSLDRLLEYLSSKPWHWELVVVSDGSTDRTAEIVSEYSARHPRVMLIEAAHGGKGAAIKRGMLEARGEWRFMCDADLSMPPEHLDRFFAGDGGRPKFDVSIASREARGARRIGEPLKRHIYGRLFNYFVQIVALRGIKDTQCGFKLYSAKAVETVFPHQRLMGWGFDVEVLFLARKAGLSIGEVAIDWTYHGPSTMTLRKGALGFMDVARIRMNHLTGRYRAVRRPG